MNRDMVERILLDYGALRRADADPELQAVRAAILVEDVFGVALSDVDIDQTRLADPSAVVSLVARRRRAV